MSIKIRGIPWKHPVPVFLAGRIVGSGKVPGAALPEALKRLLKALEDSLRAARGLPEEENRRYCGYLEARDCFLTS